MMAREFIVIDKSRIPNMKKNISLRVCLAAVLTLSMSVFASAEPKRISSVRFIQMERITSTGRAPIVTGLSLSNDGRRLVTVGDDHKARIWDVTNGKLVHTLNDQQDWVRCVKFSPDGTVFVTGGMDDQLYCYDANNYKRVMQFEDARTSVRAISFSPSDSARMAVVGFDSSVYIYDTTVGRKMRTWETTSNDQRSVSFSPDSRYIAAAGRDGNVRIFDMANGRVVTDLRQHRLRVWALSFSEDGQYLATAGEDRKVCIWSMKDFQLLKEYEFPSGKVSALTFCGSDMVAAGSTNNRICVWNLRSSDSAPAYVMDEHHGTVAELLWDKTRNVLISCSFDSTVRFWEWDSPAMAVSDVPTIR